MSNRFRSWVYFTNDLNPFGKNFVNDEEYVRRVKIVFLRGADLYFGRFRRKCFEICKISKGVVSRPMGGGSRSEEGEFFLLNLVYYVNLIAMT